ARKAGRIRAREDVTLHRESRHAIDRISTLTDLHGWSATAYIGEPAILQSATGDVRCSAVAAHQHRGERDGILDPAAFPDVATTQDFQVAPPVLKIVGTDDVVVVRPVE